MWEQNPISVEMKRHTEASKETRFLQQNLARTRWSLASTDELLRELRNPFKCPDRRLVVDACVVRLSARSDNFHDDVGEVLANHLNEFRAPGKQAVTVDGLAQRLLPVLRADVSRPVATLCDDSDRKPRRIAAWRLYQRIGLNESSRETLLRYYGDEWHAEFMKVLAADCVCVVEIGLSELLPNLPNAFWQSVAIETQLGRREALADIREQYPAEWLWAVGRAGNTEMLDEVMELVNRRGDEVLVVNRTVLCLESFGARTELDSIRERATRLARDMPDALDGWGEEIRQALIGGDRVDNQSGLSPDRESTLRPQT